MEASLSEISGYDAIVQHFGHWPSFHDANLERLSLDENGNVRLSLKTWNTTAEKDERGYYKQTHHATVDFALSQIQSMELVGSDVWAGSILFGLKLSTENELFRIDLDPCLGVSGWFLCKTITLSLRVTPSS